LIAVQSQPSDACGFNTRWFRVFETINPKRTLSSRYVEKKKLRIKEPDVPGTWKTQIKEPEVPGMGKNATIQNIARSWRVFEKKNKKSEFISSRHLK